MEEYKENVKSLTKNIVYILLCFLIKLICVFTYEYVSVNFKYWYIILKKYFAPFFFPHLWCQVFFFLCYKYVIYVINLCNVIYVFLRYEYPFKTMTFRIYLVFYLWL